MVCETFTIRLFHSLSFTGFNRRFRPVPIGGRVGKSTSFLVAQAQRDLLVSRIAEVRALANYLKALVDLYRQDGALLAHRGISAPGSEPVEIRKK